MIEEAILSSIINDGEIFLNLSTRIKPEMFLKENNKVIFEEILRQRTGDIILISQALDKNDKLDSIGGFGALENLSGLIQQPDPVLVNRWVDSLSNEFIAHSIAVAGKKIQEAASKGFNEKLIGYVSGELLKAIDVRSLGLSTLNQQLIKEIDRLENGVSVKGLMPRSRTIGRLSGPYISGDIVVVAGSAGVGKTFWILKDAVHQVLTNNAHCLFIPLEMSGEALARRVLSQSFGISPTAIRDASVDQYITVIAREKVIDKYSKFFIAKNVNKPSEIESLARLIISQGAQKLIIVIDPAILAEPNETTGNATQDARSFWKEIKIMTERIATEIDICVTMIAHHTTKEASRNRENRRPSLEDLDTAGHQNISLGIVVRKESESLVTAYCVKNRHDRADWSAPMVWLPSTLSFEDITEYCPICAINNKATEMTWNGSKWECGLH